MILMYVYDHGGLRWDLLSKEMHFYFEEAKFAWKITFHQSFGFGLVEQVFLSWFCWLAIITSLFIGVTLEIR